MVRSWLSVCQTIKTRAIVYLDESRRQVKVSVATSRDGRCQFSRLLYRYRRERKIHKDRPLVGSAELIPGACAQCSPLG